VNYWSKGDFGKAMIVLAIIPLFIGIQFFGGFGMRDPDPSSWNHRLIRMGDLIAPLAKDANGSYQNAGAVLIGIALAIVVAGWLLSKSDK